MTADEEFFEAHRRHLRAVAYRMLGSLSDAEDAVQEAWLRYQRADTGGVTNLGGWLTTVVGRICLDMLRSRASRREEPLEGEDAPVRLPDPVVRRADPEEAALAADEVGLAMLVVLDRLGPAERLAFVLHDMFAVPFEQIAEVLDRTPNSAAQLASRARRRVRTASPQQPDPDMARQREAVDAFFAASREGDFDALVAVLHPDIVVVADGGTARRSASQVLRGARTVAEGAVTYARLSPWARPAIINGTAGVVVAPRGRPFSVMAFTVVDGKIVEIHALVDPERLAELDLAGLADGQ
ncbi:RNA polymerase sigma factor SigJ [Streptomyces sp. 6N223]|uniref:RNA polymerase sigma factor SigJ n=1 Tax=Streptomyces sp. 6N223 TaxID=3457412 RepID=UPI003FD5908E